MSPHLFKCSKDIDMRRKSLTDYDELSDDMLAYLRNNGPHFNRKLYEFAVSRMTKMSNGKKVKMTPISKEEVKRILNDFKVDLENDLMYDSAYVACMCRADFLGSSIEDEEHMAKYIKDVIDDVDAPDGLVFNRFYADCCYCGEAIDWEEML